MTSTTFSSRSTVESVWGRIRSGHWQWSGWRVSSSLVGLAGHRPRCPLPSWRVPVLLHLLLLLGNPRLPLLLLQGEQGLLPCRNWLNLHSLQNDHLANI